MLFHIPKKIHPLSPPPATLLTCTCTLSIYANAYFLYLFFPFYKYNSCKLNEFPQKKRKKIQKAKRETNKNKSRKSFNVMFYEISSFRFRDVLCWFLEENKLSNEFEKLCANISFDKNFLIHLFFHFLLHLHKKKLRWKIIEIKNKGLHAGFLLSTILDGSEVSVSKAAGRRAALRGLGLCEEYLGARYVFCKWETVILSHSNNQQWVHSSTSFWFNH